MSEGYFSLQRRLLDSRLWLAEPFTRGQAWADMIGLANHSTGYMRKRGIRVELKRGHLGWSQIELAKRWKWSRGKIKRFLNELEKDGNLIQQTVQQNNYLTTLIFIVNYDQFQSNGTADSTASGQQTDSRQYRNNNEDNGNKDNKIFIRPTIDEITTYCEERKNGINPQAFLDHYNTVGWLVGKNKLPMKSWKSAVGTWEQNRKGAKNGNTKKSAVERVQAANRAAEQREQSGTTIEGEIIR